MSEFDKLCRRQRGVVTRSQAFAAGLTPETLRSRLVSGRWQRLSAGTYATFTGEVPRAARRWAAVLRAGPGAVLSHRSAAEEVGLAPDGTGPVHVTIPVERRTALLPGVVVHRSPHARARRHPTRLPPQTRVEETVLDLASTAPTVEEAMRWIADACGRRLTTPDRIRRVLSRRARVPRRPVLRLLLDDVSEGCLSVLERRYRNQVELRHGLPRAVRQAVRRRAGGKWYDDVWYADHRVRVELDGRAAHPDAARWREHRRDNAAVQAGEVVLRYGMADVAEQPCRVAAQVAAVLRRAGWRGDVRLCGDSCVAKVPPEGMVGAWNESSSWRSAG